MLQITTDKKSVWTNNDYMYEVVYLKVISRIFTRTYSKIYIICRALVIAHFSQYLESV